MGTPSHRQVIHLPRSPPITVLVIHAMVKMVKIVFLAVIEVRWGKMVKIVFPYSVVTFQGDPGVMAKLADYCNDVPSTQDTNNHICLHQLKIIFKIVKRAFSRKWTLIQVSQQYESQQYCKEQGTILEVLRRASL